MPSNFVIEAAASGGSPKVTGTAYTGGKLRQYYWDDPLVVDLAGVDAAGEIPLLADHYNSATNRLGLVAATVKNDRIDVDGTIVSETDRAKEIVAQGKAGADWQLSIGATILAVEHVREGTRTINGQEHTAPFYHVTKSKLNEVSVVAVGADQATHMQIAAALIQSTHPEGVPPMPKPGEQTPAVPPVQAAAPGAEPPTQTPEQITAAAVAAERQRIAAVAEICAGEYPEIEAKAIKEGHSVDQVRAEVLTAMRAARPQAGNIQVRRGVEGNEMGVIQAALMQTFGVGEQVIIAECGEQTIEAAAKRYRRGIGLQQMLIEAAAANGCQYHDFRNYHRDILQAAFSSASLPGILSNVANKRLLASFNAVEQVWREICSIRPTNDFKATTSYRMTGDLGFQKVGPDGEIKHGTVGEESYTNQAETYARMLAITRAMQINDDIGALDGVLARIGRGAALKLNSVFWMEFKDNAAFFATGNNNYITGATTNLGTVGLGLGNTKFRKLVDGDGDPIGHTPKILLTPVELEVLAVQLMGSMNLALTGTTDAVAPTANPWVGKFKPVSSAYLNDSTTAWYLLADPADVPVIETVFLNGQQQPTIESTDADFNTLGIQMRGYFDFGVNKQDPRGGIKSKGAAA